MHIHSFLGLYLLYNAVRVFMALLRHSDQCVYLFQQNVVYFANLCHLVREIYTFFEKHAQKFKCPLRKIRRAGTYSRDLTWHLKG